MLRCPADDPIIRQHNWDAYKNFISNVREFKVIDSLPVAVYFGEVTVSDLINNRAVWHKSCHVKFNNTKLIRTKNGAAKRCLVEADETNEPRRSKRCSIAPDVCVFCLEAGNLHRFSTKEADRRLRLMVTELQETELHARIAGGDLTAIDAMHQKNCLTNMNNKYRAYKRKENATLNIDEHVNESRAFSELVSYMENCMRNDSCLIFKLSELHSLYVDRLASFGIHKTVNKTRFKQQILDHFPDWP